MAEFYDHPASGALHLRAPAACGNSVYDAPATPADIARHPHPYAVYLARKRHTLATAEANRAHEAAATEAKTAIAELAAEKAALERQVATLSAAVGKL